jgi:hypothetical protein
MARKQIPQEVRDFMYAFRLGRKIVYILGSGLEAIDLSRVDMQRAKAIFVLAQYQSEDAFHEDEHNGLRVSVCEREGVESY